MTKGVVSRVLARHCRHNRFRKVIPDRLIGETVPVVFDIGVFAKFGRALLRLTDAGYHSRKSERRVIETVLGREPELSFAREWWQLSVGAHSSIIWNDPKNAFRLLAFRGVTRRSAIGRCLRGLCSLGLCLGFLL